MTIGEILWCILAGLAWVFLLLQRHKSTKTGPISTPPKIDVEPTRPWPR